MVEAGMDVRTGFRVIARGWALAGLVLGSAAMGFGAGQAAWAQSVVTPDTVAPPVSPVVPPVTPVVPPTTPGLPPSGSPVVPEVIVPRGAPTLPPGSGGDQGLSAPRSENPLAPSEGTRPVPDAGVLTPPAPGSSTVIPPPATGGTPVIRPPASSNMPVIAPPGTAGGDRSVVPR